MRVGNGDVGEGRGPEQHCFLVVSSCVLSPAHPRYLLSHYLPRLQNWSSSETGCFVLYGAPGGALLSSDAREKPEAAGWEGFQEGAGAGWLGLCILAPAPAHSSLFALSSVVPGCTHGRRRTETPRR